MMDWTGEVKKYSWVNDLDSPRICRSLYVAARGESGDAGEVLYTRGAPSSGSEA